MTHCLILDNGAGRAKIGFDTDENPKTVTNATAKVDKFMHLVTGEQIDDFQNSSMLQFIRPFDRGYITNWQAEINVWNELFSSDIMKSNQIQPCDCSLILTEPPFNPPSIQNDTNEVVFEYFGFDSYMRQPAFTFSAYNSINQNKRKNTSLNDYNNDLGSCLIVESGFSFSHVAPFINGKCQKQAIRRLNIGGKLLTNYLKEIVSYRQWNMMDEFCLMNKVKEDLCYVSQDFLIELKNSKVVTKADKNRVLRDPYGGKLKKQFVLPDFQNILKGYVKPDDEENNPDEQVLNMEIERFSVPEILFSPGDLNLGFDQAGIAETGFQSIQALDNQMKVGLCTSNVVLTGGNVNFPGFEERFKSEFRSFIPDIHQLNISKPDFPELFAWQGAAQFSRDQKNLGTLEDYMVSKQDFLENGHGRCNDKFWNNW